MDFRTGFEDIIAEISDAIEGDQISALRDQYIVGLIQVAGARMRDSIEASILSGGLSEDKKKIVAAYLLRLICANMDSVLQWGAAERVKVLDLIEEQLPSVCKSQQIGDAKQRHEKIAKLSGTEQRILDEFDRLVNRIVNLDTAGNSRQQFMRALGKPANEEYLNVFWDRRLAAAERLTELFDVLDEYIRASDVDRLTAYTKAEAAFERYAQDAGPEPHPYTTACLLAPVENIFSQIKQDLNSRGIADPAELRVVGTKRKYPLHETERKISLKLDVRNSGPGWALDVVLRVIEASDGFDIEQEEIVLPDVEPGQLDIFVNVKVKERIQSTPFLSVLLSWRNFDGTQLEVRERIEFEKQREDLDWTDLSRRKPYSLEAVSSEDELIGRRQLIDSLHASLTSGELESYIIWGQKRVGKTSIAQALQSKLVKRSDYLVTYTLTNQLDKRSADRFVSALGESIAEQLLSNPLLADTYEMPKFDGALYPLRKLLQNIDRLGLGLRVIIIIDEFDELPERLVAYNDDNETFFGNLRDLSTLPGTGFMLVGGENMREILERSAGGKLNKFASYTVDYFDKESAWQDFREFVQRPVEGVIEYADDAVLELHNLTEGNPFFAKLLCRNLYSVVCENRDAYVTREDVVYAFDQTIHKRHSSRTTLDLNNMSHFWADGIPYGDRAERDETETQRRKFLLCFANARQNQRRVTERDLLKAGYLESEVALRHVMESFKARRILLNTGAGIYRLRPRLLENWLVENGASQLTTTFHDKVAIQILQQKIEKNFVRDTEILDVIEKWPVYNGQKIEIGHVRRWLDQFENLREQRLMFTLMRHLRFFSVAAVHESLEVIHDRVKTKREIREGEKARRDLIVSAFGGIGKSGSSVARRYAQVNQILKDRVMAPERIQAFINETGRINAIVFVDDIIGSGSQAAAEFSKFRSELNTFLRDHEIKVYVGSVCGFDDGIARVRDEMRHADFACEVVAANILSDEDRCFCDESTIYETAFDREEARYIATRYGAKLVREHVLGYHDSQLLVTFSDNCPNNTLPIFWSNAGGWKPLFERR